MTTVEYRYRLAPRWGDSDECPVCHTGRDAHVRRVLIVDGLEIGETALFCPSEISDHVRTAAFAEARGESEWHLPSGAVVSVRVDYAENDGDGPHDLDPFR